MEPHYNQQLGQHNHPWRATPSLSLLDIYSTVVFTSAILAVSILLSARMNKPFCEWSVSLIVWEHLGWVLGIKADKGKNFKRRLIANSVALSISNSGGFLMILQWIKFHQCQCSWFCSTFLCKSKTHFLHKEDLTIATGFKGRGEEVKSMENTKMDGIEEQPC